ncbi:MAG: ATPase, partial [Ignavibacteria bacterium]
MAHKAIREADGTRILARLLKDYSDGKFEISDKIITVAPDTDMAQLPNQHSWLKTEKLVVKPDQLIKRRGKNKLVLVGVSYDQARAWIQEKSKSPITIYGKFDANGKPVDKGTVGQLTNFIIKPFVTYKESDECYVAIISTAIGDTIL